MFSRKAISMTAALVIFSIAAITNLWAQPMPLGGGVDIPLTFSGTATVEGLDDMRSPIDTIHAGFTQKISTPYILGLIGAASTMTFSEGALLVLDVTGADGGAPGDVWAVDSQGPELDVTSAGYLTIATDPDGLAVFRGDSNSANGSESYKGAYIAVITFSANNGNAFNFTGLTNETYSRSKPAKNGNQKLTDTITITAVGDGTINGSNAAFSATVRGTGSSIVNNSGP